MSIKPTGDSSDLTFFSEKEIQKRLQSRVDWSETVVDAQPAGSNAHGKQLIRLHSLLVSGRSAEQPEAHHPSASVKFNLAKMCSINLNTLHAITC